MLYCEHGKIRWAKLLGFSRLSGVPQKFFREYKCLSLIILNNEYFMAKAMQKYFCKNFDGTETVNIIL